MTKPTCRDDELREALKKIDEDETIEVTNWEAEFIESVVFRYDGFLSAKQMKVAERIVEKYER